MYIPIKGKRIMSSVEEKREYPQLMDEIVLARKPDQGAPTVLTTGRLGAGKTSLLADIACQLLNLKDADEDRPQSERLFWRGQASCQFLKLHGEIPYQVLVPESTEVQFISEDGFDIKQREFSTFPELYEMADPNKLNVIYCSYEELVDFAEWIQMTKFSWNSLFCDEVEDLAPQGIGGNRFKQNKRVANILKESRKYRLSFYMSTQSHSDIDWRVTKKIMAWIFLTGAPPSKNTPIWKSAIQKLDQGEGWVSVGGNYSPFSFPPYVTKVDVKARISHSPKRIPKPEILDNELELGGPGGA